MTTVQAMTCPKCGSRDDARHRRTGKHMGNVIAGLFWTYNAVAVDEDGNAHIVGRTDFEQVPRLRPDFDA